jgi:hypothetical protein
MIKIKLLPIFYFLLAQNLLGQDSSLEDAVMTPDQFAEEVRTVYQSMERSAQRLTELSMLYRNIDLHSPAFPRAMLGLAVDNSESGAGVVVESVSPRGPANRSDIRVGDIISDINGVPITVVADLLNFMSQVEPGSSVILTVERMGFKGDITVETMPMHMARIPYGMDDSEFLLPDRGRSNNDHDRDDDRSRDRDDDRSRDRDDDRSRDRDDDRSRDRDDDARQSNYRSAWNAMHHYELIEVDESLEPYFGVSEGLLLLFSNDGWRNESQGRSLQLHQGDVIVSIEGSSVQDRRTFIRDFINEIREDNLVSLGIVRRGEPMQLLLDLN